MDNRIFRKASLDRVNAPDRVDDCLEVPNPSLWLIVAALLLLFFGMGVWTLFSNSEQRIPAVVKVEDGIGYCMISSDYAEIAGGKGTVSLETRTIPVMIETDRADGANVTAARFEVLLENGIYNGELIFHVKPIDTPEVLFRSWR